ncbi:NYN domain-containing protein [Brotaphodocola sp.]|uniref:NYN domain-containing protein n=1 Tax=Brotaphodocola sp. TaxID=3073577 RepID=UPI003D7E5EE1
MAKRLVMGILAHVDAGKTTLSEGILFETGTIRKMGRVDNRDAYLDTYALERERGITIFSKQAEFKLGEISVTLLDTPGHVDFSAEMERTLQVLDCAVLVVSGADGVQGHTETLWKLLKRYQIPTFVFVNKMDQAGTDRDALMSQLHMHLDENCVAFDFQSGGQPMSAEELLGEADEEWLEALAMCEESAMEEYLENGKLSVDTVRRMIRTRKVFPCYFGSALKLDGVDGLLEGLRELAPCPEYGNEFGAKVFKISRDAQGNRLTHMKITGGVLRVKDLIAGREAGEAEKVNQIRVYSGSKFETVNEAEAGIICAVTGPAQTYPGQGIGAESESELPVLEPVLTYRLMFPEGGDLHKMLGDLRQLEEEEPQLHIVWDEELGEIQAQVMGEVQIEVLKRLIQERFGTVVEFGEGNIVYKERLTAPVEGVGHFEPLRHYAEVHLLMEPAERGSGLQFEAYCSEDALDRNWQRLILTHLEEKRHRGVLTGAEITDMKITLIAGRAHQKHTEGGDFRQATYRAVRQGLCEACAAGEYELLEPFYEFRLEVPAESVGRAMADLDRMQAKFSGPEPEGERMVLEGSAPVSLMRDYQREVVSYTRGRGRLACTLKGYFPCHNAVEVVESTHYDAEADLYNPTGSVFCAHGAGFVVPWDQVKSYMQVESPLAKAFGQSQASKQENLAFSAGTYPNNRAGSSGVSGASGGYSGASSYGVTEDELEEIFTRTYGESKRRLPNESGPRVVEYDPQRAEQIRRNQRTRTANGTLRGAKGADGREDSVIHSVPGAGRPGYLKQNSAKLDEYLLVDGYNILYAWDELRELMQVTLDGARHRLMDMLCNYQGYRGCHLIVVFDAYKVPGGTGSVSDYHNIHVVYTKEAETADQYIEKFAHEMGRKYRVTVATSDGLEQLIIRGQGCLLMSARDLEEDMERVSRQIEEERGNLPKPGKRYLFAEVEKDLAEYLEKIKKGEITLENG